MERLDDVRMIAKYSSVTLKIIKTFTSYLKNACHYIT